MIDKKAFRILSSTFWSSTGWRDDNRTAPEDFKYAKSQGLMFDPITVTHDEIVDRAVTIATNTKPIDVADAFLASLTSRRLDLRSALGSYAAVRHLKRHRLAPTVRCCEKCGEYHDRKKPKDLNVLSFERFKWGGVRHDSPLYAWFDLERFSESECLRPSSEDKDCLAKILDVASSLSPAAKLAELVRGVAPLFKSNDDERRVLISILGYAGVLQPKSQPSFFEAYVSKSDRDQTPWSKDDWPFPIQWWRGADGVNWEAAQHWFPGLTSGKRSS